MTFSALTTETAHTALLIDELVGVPAPDTLIFAIFFLKERRVCLPVK